MAGVVVQLGAQSGLVVPLIAVHLFVFYFGIMADVTPPVGLASFAAAAVSGGDAIKTGFTAFFYSLRTVALPFVFIFNTDLLWYEVTWYQGLLVAVISMIAVLVFTAGTMGYFVTKSRIYESVALVLIAFILFRPDFFMNRIQPPFEVVNPEQVTEAFGKIPAGHEMRLNISGPDFDTGSTKETTLVITSGDEQGGDARLSALGLAVIDEDGVAKLDEPMPGTPFFDTLGGFDFYADDPVKITHAEIKADQMPKDLIYIPGLLLLGGVYLLQRARAGRKEEVPA